MRHRGTIRKLSGRAGYSAIVFVCLSMLVATPVRDAAEPQDPLARLAGEFGRIYSEGRYADAAKVAAEILGYLQDHRGPLDLDLAANLNNLGSLAYAQGKFDLAEPFFRKSLDIYETMLGPSDSNVAAVLYNLAGLYVERNLPDDALALFERSLAIRQSALGEGHPLVAETLNNIGFIHLSRANEPRAESAFRRALEIWQRQAGADAPYAAVALNNLARLKTRQRQFAEARSFYEQARQIEEQVFGEDHPETAITMLNLAELHQAAGDAGRAVETARQALDILYKTLGPGDPATVHAASQWKEFGDRAQAGRNTASPAAGSGRYQILVVSQRAEAAALYEKLRGGGSFAALAREFSVDPSGENGGFFEAHPGDLNETVRASLAALQIGETSAPFRLGLRWAIVKKIEGP